MRVHCELFIRESRREVVTHVNKSTCNQFKKVAESARQ
jgi:hypothetical protein